MRKRPTEVKAVKDCLMMDWDDIDDAAEAIIEAIDQLRAKRDYFTNVVHVRSAGLLITYGPYNTAGEADREAKKLVASKEGDLVRYGPLKMAQLVRE